MILTEEQAKGQWCPYAKGEGFRESRCLASKCMAWRVRGDDDPAGFIRAIKQRREQTGATLAEAKAWAEKNYSPPPVGGYCGLAGRPE